MDSLKYYLSGWWWCCPPDTTSESNFDETTQHTVQQNYSSFSTSFNTSAFDTSNITQDSHKQTIKNRQDSSQYCFQCSKQLLDKSLLNADDDTTLQSHEEELAVLRAKVGFLEMSLDEARRSSIALKVNTTELRNGTEHVRRGDSTQAGSLGFPAGDELCKIFIENTTVFESFTSDAVLALEPLLRPHEDPMEVLVGQVLRPLHELTLFYVTRCLTDSLRVLADHFGVTVPGEKVPSEASLVKQFWLFTQQRRIPALINKFTEQDLESLFSKLPVVCALHANLRGNTSVIQMVRRYMHIHALALLSEPRCYLEPWPGALVIHREGHTKEVQGSEPESSVEAGDAVQVVHCGLYFEPPGPAVLPVVASTVYRPSALM